MMGLVLSVTLDERCWAPGGGVSKTRERTTFQRQTVESPRVPIDRGRFQSLPFWPAKLDRLSRKNREDRVVVGAKEDESDWTWRKRT